MGEFGMLRSSRKSAIVMEMRMHRWLLIGLATFCCVAGVWAQTRGDQSFTCRRAADKLDGLIVEWHQLVVDYSAEAKNPSVLKMMSEHKRGRLKTNFTAHCNQQWEMHQAIFVCFSGSVSALGLALCHQSDTNPNHWQYQP